MTPEVLSEFAKCNDYLKSNFNTIIQANMQAILQVSGGYEAETISPSVSSAELEKYGGSDMYIMYNGLLFTTCLMRWSKKPDEGGLGLDGSYDGLRAPSRANVCCIS